MQRSRRKKIFRFLVFFILLLFISGYIFRYPLILQFQYWRVRTLNCQAVSSDPEGGCLPRIWVHRVNSLERYDLLKNKFQGFETDVSFNESSLALDVRHQPLITEGDTLTLDKFFQHVDLRTKHFWLDMRLGNAANMHQALSALSRLDAHYNIRQACIVELYDVAAAALFAKNGYTVSLNVTANLQRQLLANQLLQDSIDQQLIQVKYISRDGRYLPPVKKLFPGKRIITWHVAFKDFFDRKPIRELLDDPQIDIILVNIKTPFFR